MRRQNDSVSFSVLVVCYFSFAQLIYLNLMFVDTCILVQFIQKKPTRCNNVSKFIIPYLYEAQHVSGGTPPIIRSSTALAASGFAYVKGCWMLWLLDAVQQPQEKVGYCYPSRLEKTLCKWDIMSRWSRKG